jgi:hypothetical protein
MYVFLYLYSFFLLAITLFFTQPLHFRNVSLLLDKTDGYFITQHILIISIKMHFNKF